jgi:hypothetical protein
MRRNFNVTAPATTTDMEVPSRDSDDDEDDCCIIVPGPPKKLPSFVEIPDEDAASTSSPTYEMLRSLRGRLSVMSEEKQGEELLHKSGLETKVMVCFVNAFAKLSPATTVQCSVPIFHTG